MHDGDRVLLAPSAAPVELKGSFSDENDDRHFVDYALNQRVFIPFGARLKSDDLDPFLPFRPIIPNEFESDEVSCLKVSLLGANQNGDHTHYGEDERERHDCLDAS